MSKISRDSCGWNLRLGGSLLAIALPIAFFGNSTLAQITPDQTLGAERSVITPNINIKGLSADRIDGGAIRGANLFHSFEQFNVGEGQRVYFANPAGIENILSRVTGTDASDILGTLGVKGGANLFLLNPNGIIFGQNAQLDIRGSFVASTANALVFGNGYRFSATNPNAPPLLTVNVPIGLQYGVQQPATINNSGNLQVGGSLTLLAGAISSTGKLAAPAGEVRVVAVDGDVQVQEVSALSAILFASNNLILEESQVRTAGDLTLFAGNTVRVRDSVANPFVAHAGGNLYIQGNQGIDILALNHAETPFQSGGNLSLVSDGIISGDAHFASGGTFSILNLAGEPGNFVSLYDPIISSEKDVVLGDYTGVSLKVESLGSITTGNITITGRDTTLTSGSDPDISILRRSPALILRAGLSELENAPNVPVSAGGTTFSSVGELSSPGSITVGNISITQSSSITFSDFSNVSNLKLNGDTTQESNVLRLTPDQKGQSGSAFLSNSFTIRDNTSFQTQFQFRIHGNAVAGDGFVFMLQNNSDGINAIGGGGGGQGYKKLSPSIAVEFDIYQNLGASDPNSNHVALLRDGSVDHNLGLPVVTPSFNLDSGSSSDSRNAWIDYNGTTNQLEVFLSESSIKPSSRLFSYNIDLPSVLDSKAFIGFGAGTGDAHKSHDIQSWQFNITDRGGPVIMSAPGDINLKGGIASNGGNIILNSGGTIEASGVIIDSTNNVGLGNSGDIKVTARSVALSDGARLLSRVVSNNDGGDITVKASEFVNFTGSLTEGNSTGIFATSDGSGEPGNVRVETPDLILEGRARVLSEAYNLGNAGELTIKTDRLIIRDGARVSTLTSGQGKGGNLIVNATESVEVSGTDGELPSAITTSALTNGLFNPGDAGNLTINTDELVVQDGGIVTASTVTAGQGGNLTVNASTVKLSSTGILNNGDEIPSGLFTDTSNVGNAGDLTINTDRLIVEKGAVASASTFGGDSQRSQGGDLIVNASSIKLSGRADSGFSSGLYAQTFGAGQAGNLTINTQDLIVQDRARVTVAAGGNTTVRVPTVLPRLVPNIEIPQNIQATGDAGNIEVTADFISLDNQGQIIAETESTEGGNITLNARDLLLLRHNSSISTTAGTDENREAGGNGGNITINTPFVVGIPRENSDITANAFLGNGGSVTITAQGIYGLKFRPDLTPRSDITASSEFGNPGVVTLNLPDIDPNRGLVNIPQPQDPDLIEQGCPADDNRFTVTGRGGLPPQPDEALRAEAIIPPTNANQTTLENQPIPSKPTQIVEAQGWVINAQGQVILVAYNPNVTSSNPWSNRQECHAP